MYHPLSGQYQIILLGCNRDVCQHLVQSRYVKWNGCTSIWPGFLRTVGGGRPLLPEILGKPAPVGEKSLILNRYSLVAPQL